MVIARAGIRSDVREAGLSRPAADLLVSVLRPRGPDSTPRPTCRRRQLAAAPSADTFRQFLDQQQIFVFFVTVYVGAGLIANDRRANALQIYLSKPLTRAEYVFGKLGDSDGVPRCSSRGCRRSCC